MGQEEFWGELDKLGEEQVQQNFDLGLYGGRKKDWAKAWLKKQKRIIPWYKKWWGGALITLGVLLIGAALSSFILPA